MITLITIQKVLKLEFFALAAMYWAIPSHERSALEYDHPNLPNARYFRHFVSSCQFAIGAVDNNDLPLYFWDCYDALFVAKPLTQGDLICLNENADLGVFDGLRHMAIAENTYEVISSAGTVCCLLGSILIGEYFKKTTFFVDSDVLTDGKFYFAS